MIELMPQLTPPQMPESALVKSGGGASGDVSAMPCQRHLRCLSASLASRALDTTCQACQTHVSKTLLRIPHHAIFVCFHVHPGEVIYEDVRYPIGPGFQSEAFKEDKESGALMM